MSMHFTDDISRCLNPKRLWWALMLARYVRACRKELQLSVADAARLSGLQISQWWALEAGWVPDPDDPVLKSIAGTLEINWKDLASAALCSAENRKRIYEPEPASSIRLA